MMEYNIAVIKGDGIGPEVVDAAIEVLNEIGKKYKHNFKYEEVLAGGVAYDVYNNPLPEETLEICRNSDAVILGAVGGPKWDDLPGDKRPEAALLGLRKGLGLYANLRPAILFEALSDACPLKPEIIGEGLDICVVRELTGGIYFGDRGYKETEMGMAAYDIMIYSKQEIERIAKVAFNMAQKRSKILTSVDKANILESSRLWRKTVEEVAKDYPDVTLNHMYVDNAAMQLVRYPQQFDVIVTENMFGDILSDEASMITGSIGMLPSASLGENNKGMYEPVHGSAPDIAGQGKANPIATIMSIAMMLKYSFNLSEESENIEFAVKKALDEGHRTLDIVSKGDNALGTKEMTQVILKNI
ncbi:3-isopropylmalate dehydrogenase [Alkalibaculum sp. M08DMB]|uniref:3-isopropylmalate dehydrogenase n=2 Tax=Alkalibaculum sporogenes TaxID=2655001 RepID=A0A6A7K749_9FIRM|nr:3-isopropylmalate dehydrogenase [Alkalibaculum sporogenes]MPW25270.1 3-isopropylmalate dehydrogenase [Alkalibaculum sporogenes]